MKPRLFVLAALLCCVAGCKTQTMLTANATGCRTISVDIMKTRYAREGSTTQWCAKCKNTLYHCVSNPERSRVVCKEAGPDVCE